MNTLKDVIDDFILEKDDNNSIFRHSRRTHIKALAMRGLKALNYTLKGNVRAISFNVPSSQQFEAPVDYEDYVRVSVMLNCNLYPISYNDSIPAYVEAYLQDCGNEFLYDCCNEVVSIETSSSCRHCEVAKECNICMPMCICDYECPPDYWFQVEGDRFVFSPALEGKEVFIEYMSSGWYENMDECEIKVKKTFNEPLIAWIRWQYLRGINEHMGRIEEHRRYYKQLSKELRYNELDVDSSSIIKILDHRFSR